MIIKITSALLIATIVALVGIGLYQNHQMTSLDGCAKFDASDKFWRYTCDNGTFYISKG